MPAIVNVATAISHDIHLLCWCCLQDTIEGKLEKRTKGVFAPAGGKHLVAFIDDLNMPQKSKFGFIPPLELLKLWVDNGFW
jgi:dynein heavy chain